MHIRRFRTIKDYLKPCFTTFIMITSFIIIFITITVCVCSLINILEEDVTKKEEITNIQKTTIVIKKKNGLTNELHIDSNGQLSTSTLMFYKSTLLIKEKGINFIGLEIESVTRVENVDTFYIKK